MLAFCRVAMWCAVLICVAGSAAQAHAYVIETDPKTNGTVQSGPRTVSVTFDEPITLESRAPLVVTGAGGAAYPCAKPAHLDPDDETTVDCELAAPLQRGAYAVAWRVTSADTHVVHGIFSFGVGVAVNGPSGETASIYDPSGPLAATLRWLVYLGAALVFGCGLFALFVLRPSAYVPEAAGALAAMRTRAALLVRFGVITAALASIAALFVQGAAATGTDPLQALPALGGIVTGSTWGLAWLARMIALALMALLLGAGAGAGIVGLLPGLAVLVTFSVSGHAVGTLHPLEAWLPVSADAIHLIAVATWIGGLVLFTTAANAARRGMRAGDWSAFVGTAIRRFTLLAVTAVIAIIVTGTYAAVLHIPGLLALVTTLYGRIVLAKVLFLFPLVVLGNRNLREGRGERVPLRFERAVAVEALLILVVLGLSSVLTGLAPPPPAVIASP